MKKDYQLMQKKESIHFFPYAYVIGRVFTFTMKKLFGKGFGPTLALYKNGFMYWYASQSGLESAGLAAFEKLKKDPGFLNKLHRQFKKKITGFEAFVHRAKNPIKNFNNRQCAEFLRKFLSEYESCYLISEPAVLAVNNFLEGYLQEYLKPKVTGKKHLYSIYSLLAAPNVKSFVKKEEDDLLKIAARVKKNKVPPAEWGQLIKDHAKKYSWIPFDYGVYAWDEAYFKKTLENILLKRNIKQDLKKSQKYIKDLPKQQSKIFRRLKIDKFHKKLFGVLQTATVLQDFKKEVFTKIHFQTAPILQEITNRLGTPKALLQYYLPHELQAVLKTGKRLSQKELKNRFKYSLAYWHEDKCELLQGEKAKKLFGFYSRKHPEEKTEIGGTIASPGKCIGVAKILQNAAQIIKVSHGDVLITHMTSPDYIPAMRKAAAIVTDEGGIISHAAIVSRELGIPCIVGTKNATKLLRDGDLVEVNANHGWVRKLSP